MKSYFVKKGCYPSLINEHLERISLLNRIDLITEKDTPQKSGPLVVTHNQFLRNITKTIKKNWNTLQINENEPITAFKRNKNIQEIIWTRWIEHGSV